MLLDWCLPPLPPEARLDRCVLLSAEVEAALHGLAFRAAHSDTRRTRPPIDPLVTTVRKNLKKLG